jgi:glycine cleavage system regulatory protein
VFRYAFGHLTLFHIQTMSKHLVITVIGDDRPGLVEALAAIISAHRGNWLDASMAHLAGKFAGLVRVDVPADQTNALVVALTAFEPLRVVVEVANMPASEGTQRRLCLDLVGHDRIGIVREVSQVLARHGVNVESLETRTSAAPMSGETLFHATAVLRAPESLPTGVLQADLEAISGELQVDIALGADESA